MSLTLPLDSTDPHYTVVVALEGVRYKIKMDWNERVEAWAFSLLLEDDTKILSGVRVIPDWPVLRKVASSNAPPGEIYFRDTSGDGEPPGRYDLGERVVATYFEESEL